MGAFTFRRTVTLGDKPHHVTVSQKSESAWIAVGEYMGERLEVKGGTDSQAIGSWRDAAKYKARSKKYARR